jgi:xylan 1,4-beta-xylosidase
MKRRSFLRQALLSAAGAALLPKIVTAGTIHGKNTLFDEQLLTIDTKLPGRGFTHYWSKCVGGGRAADVLRPDWLEQLQYVQKSCGFEYCRLHGLLHDELYVYTNGSYNWEKVDEVLTRLQKAGLKPFIVIDCFPKDLAGGNGTAYWWKANITPPVDMSKWASFIGTMARHLLEKFGSEEVGTWYFEVWHEPNQHAYWDGTRQQYFELYKTTAQALKGASPKIKVGGPGTSNFVPDDRYTAEWEEKSRITPGAVPEGNAWKGVWINEFLGWCKQEQLPLDFISTHPYPTDLVFGQGLNDQARMRGLGATASDLQWLKAALAKNGFAKTEVHLTEWGSSPAAHDAVHDNLPEAAFIIKNNVDAIGLADSMAYPSFIDVYDENGAGNIFHGGPGMLTSQGVAKPAFHGYRLLHMLGEELVYNKDGIIVTRHKATQRITALVYNYPANGTPAYNTDGGAGDARNFTFNLTSVHGNARFNIEILDRQNGNVLTAWKAMGSPDSPDMAQIKSLQKEALALNEEQVIANGQGLLQFGKTLQPWSVVLIDEGE